MATLNHRVTHLLLAVILVALVAVITMLATGAAGGPLDPPSAPASTSGVKLPGTPITAPITITQRGHYYLTTDLFVTGSQPAIAINTSDVSLDLGGFNVIGDRTSNGVGIAVGQHQWDVRIFNGNVRSFYIGISAPLSKYVRIENVNVRATVARAIVIGSDSVVTRCGVSGNSAEGIFIEGEGSLVDRCHVADNFKNGVVLVGNSNAVTGTVFAGNGAFGTDTADVRMLGDRGTVSGNVFVDRGTPQVYITGQNAFVDDNSGCPIWIKNLGPSTFVSSSNTCVQNY